MFTYFVKYTFRNCHEQAGVYIGFICEDITVFGI